MALDEAFWAGEREQLVRVLLPHIEQAALDGTATAIGALEEVAGIGIDRDLVNQAVADWARQHVGELDESMTATTRKFVAQATAQWVESGKPLSALLDQLTQTFAGPGAKQRARLVGVTEVTRAYHQANVIVWRASDVVDEFRFRTANDQVVCPVCSPLEGETFPLDDSEHAPPIHGRCRCYSQPVVKLP